MKVTPDQKILYVRESPTKLVGGTVSLANNADPILVSGGPNQKQVAISNNDAASSVLVYDRIGGTIIQKIFPRTSWTLLTSAAVYVASTSGSFDIYVAKTVYTDDLP